LLTKNNNKVQLLPLLSDANRILYTTCFTRWGN